MHREHVDSRKLRVVTHHYPENTSLEPAQHAPGHRIRENNHAICLVQHSFRPGKPSLRTAWPTCSNRFALLSSSPARRHRLLVPAEPRNAHPHAGHCLRSQPAALSHAATRILPGTHSDAKTPQVFRGHPFPKPAWGQRNAQVRPMGTRSAAGEQGLFC